MRQHYVYFYGSTRLILGRNSLSEDAINKRNQIVGFEGIDQNPELVEYGKRCFDKINEDRSRGETGSVYSKNITIVPFRYLYNEDLIIRHLEDVINANENYIKAESIGFPLMMLKTATSDCYNYLGKGNDLYFIREREIDFKNRWCCYGHYYLHLLKIALKNKGYSLNGFSANEISGNLINKKFIRPDGIELTIHADAGL